MLTLEEAIENEEFNYYLDSENFMSAYLMLKVKARGQLYNFLQGEQINPFKNFTHIPDHFMAWDSQIESIDLTGTDIEFIGNGAFSNNQGLKSVKLNDSLKRIGENSFYNCENICSLSFGKNLIHIGPSAFEKCCSLPYITLSDKVSQIDEYAFAHCYELGSVVLGRETTLVANNAFEHNSSLQKVVIYNKLGYIGEYTFHKCPKLLELQYMGRRAEWATMYLGTNWCDLNLKSIRCSDGTLEF